jgi:hypothetical protein
MAAVLAVTEPVLQRVEYFRNVDVDLGERVERASAPGNGIWPGPTDRRVRRSAVGQRYL